VTDVDIIHAVFKDIIGRATDFSSFDDRLEAQKIVYLLSQAGTSCGDYPFRWYKHGPYSQQLQNTLLKKADGMQPVVFSETGKAALSKIKKMKEESHAGYSDSQWLEALGSIHYLQKYMYPTYGQDNIIEELKTYKPLLKECHLNKRAYTLLKENLLLP